MEAEQREELRRLADQCICHPLSRGVREVEQAGEGIKELLDELADTEKAYALLFAENARLRAELEAIAQPAQEAEPVGYMNAGHVYELQQKRAGYGYVYPENVTGADTAVYTTPQQSQPLTDEQIGIGCVESGCDDGQGEEAGFFAGARFAEKHHNIKGVTE